MDAVDEVRRAFGFCAEHVEMLRRIDVEDMKTTLSTSVRFADVFAGVLEQLQALSPDESFKPAQCPACGARLVAARDLPDNGLASPGPVGGRAGAASMTSSHVSGNRIKSV